MKIDVAIVGAGPAGSLAANLLARRGFQVLLIDKADFPRAKVCGCCVNRWAQGALYHAGLGDLLEQLSAKPVESVTLALAHRRATIRVPTIYAVTRSAFDAALVNAAVHNGAVFLPHTRAQLGDAAAGSRRLHLRSAAGEQSAVDASVILAADGIGGDLLRDEPGAEFIRQKNSRIGVGVTLPVATNEYQAGTIYMACGPRGYIGLVRTEGESLDIAAAVEPAMLQDRGGPGLAAAAMIADARLPPIADLPAAAWRGTRPLTRRRRHLAFERVFVIGDSAAYVEPFTGDGIACALWSAAEVVQFAARACAAWEPALIEGWTSRYRARFGARQRASRAIAALLRSRTAMRCSLAALAMLPALAHPIVAYIHHARLKRPLAANP